MRPERATRALLLLLATCVALTACSRLTFVRPDLGRRDFEQTSVDVELDEAKPREGEARARRQVLIAEQALRAGELDAAEQAARAAVKFDDAMPEAHTVLAVVLETRGRTEQAGEHYRRATELAPARGEMLNNYGVWLCRAGRAAESLAWFDRALADPRYPTPAAALANAGTCAHTAGETARAERDLRRAIALDPQNATALGTLARMEFQAGRYLQARAFSERRLAAAPADRESLLLASQIERALGDNAAAERYVRRMGTEFSENSNQGAESKP